MVSLIVANEVDPILTATEFGFGKRTKIDEYRPQARGGSGVISIKTTDRNGKVVGAIQVTDDDEMMLISDQGTQDVAIRLYIFFCPINRSFIWNVLKAF